MGEHLFGQMDPMIIRVSTAFAGGVGDARQEMCGALGGGVMLIGALHGRSTSSEKSDHCRKLVTAYRQRFVEQFGAAHCNDLTAIGYGAKDGPSCATLVEDAAALLLDLLETPLPDATPRQDNSNE